MTAPDWLAELEEARRNELIPDALVLAQAYIRAYCGCHITNQAGATVDTADYLFRLAERVIADYRRRLQ
ncbi:hypothetical protein KXS72_24460, partial [Salmonella enterica subsp. enterica serovar Weltevreden]|nr:hypothetical protein [Salmonella enterica subsp. enterica serovar Weltevreden]